MILNVLYFADLRELVGAPDEALECSAGATMADAWQALRTRHPSLPDEQTLPILPVLNRRYVSWSEPLADGAEITFLTPVSGG